MDKDGLMFLPEQLGHSWCHVEMRGGWDKALDTPKPLVCAELSF